MRLSFDLGSCNATVADGRNPPLTEPSVVATDSRIQHIVASGQAAQEMQGRTVPDIRTLRPMRNGVLAYPELAAVLVGDMLRRVSRWNWTRPQVSACVSTRCTEVHRQAMRESFARAGAASTQLVEGPLAAATGAGLPVAEAVGNLIVHLGASTTEAAVISLGRIVVGDCLAEGGDELVDSIIRAVREAHQLQLSPLVAEQVKVHLGRAKDPEDRGMRVVGRDVTSGTLGQATLTCAEVHEALVPPLSRLAWFIMSILERTPPELCADIVDRGAVLSGGGARLPGLDAYLAETINIPFKVADDPATAAARGALEVRK